MRKLAWAAMWMGLAVTAGAQSAPAGTKIEPSKAFDTLLSNFEKEVVPAAEAMPADKYSFSPAQFNLPGAKYDGVYTFAGEVAHLAQANYGLAAAITGTKPTVDTKAIRALTDKTQVVQALKDSFAAAHRAIATLTVQNENDAAGMGLSKAAMAAYIPTHGFDHYGQMVEYLRMNGIVPPASAK